MRLRRSALFGCCASLSFVACTSDTGVGGPAAHGGALAAAGAAGRVAEAGSAPMGGASGVGATGGVAPAGGTTGGVRTSGGGGLVEQAGQSASAGRFGSNAGAAGTALGNAGTSAGRTGANAGGAGAEADAAGAAGQGGDGASDPEIPAGYVRAVVGVGYGGIRVVSRDGGNTWGDRVSVAANGGDDEDLLRAVVYGKGRWLASGWKLMSSDDGLHWTDHGKFHDGLIADEQIIEGLAYKNGYFYAAGDGDPARLYRSGDGLSWSYFGVIGDTVKHTGLTFRGGAFVSYGDSKTSYRSSDGSAWTDMGIEEATYCDGGWKSFADCSGAWWSESGYYLLPQWGGGIQRSSSGQKFETVYSDDQENTLYRSRALAEGYVAPE